jgi:hypothetical protein
MPGMPTRCIASATPTNTFLAAIAGDVTDFHPKVYLDFSADPQSRGFAAGKLGLLELEETIGQELILHDWPDATQRAHVWSPAQDNASRSPAPNSSPSSPSRKVPARLPACDSTRWAQG